METVSLGKSDIQISRITMGSWQTGKRMWTGIDDNESKQALRAAFDAGITTFDTAEVYGDGHAETIIGEALGDIRSRIVLLSKVFCNHLDYNGVIKACEASLKRLGTDYLDLYQIHWPSGTFGTPEIPVEETMKAMCKLQEQGKIRAIGVSNFNYGQMEEAAQFGRLESLQPPYSLFWRFVEDDGMVFCLENDMSVLAYSPLAQGILTGKFGPDHQFEEGDHRAKSKLFQQPIWDKVQQALRELRPIAKDHNISMAQLSLAWLLAQPNTNVIVGARNAQQITDSAKAADVNLSEAELERMNEISATVVDYLEEDPIMWNF